MPVVDSAGKPVVLGREVGRGGEGVVYELVSNLGLVAKIYHRPLDANRANKINAMVITGSQEILKFAAWPLSALFSKGQMVGLLMRKFARSDKPVHELYTPKSRLREFPDATWPFLIHVASNVARGFAAIHKAGHVVGDVNHGNILISSAGISSFIDCDSFQIQADGKVFLCPVGVPPYTPPELQNRQFSTVRRTQNHDAFGLAVLVFQLLFMGRHPFAGRFSGKGEMPIERAIAEFRFPYGKFAARFQMRPPPFSLLLDQIPSAVQDSFERAFSAEAACGTARPTAIEWLDRLGHLQSSLAKCNRNKIHAYFAGLSSCPWCKIEGEGIILFIDIGAAPTPGLDIDLLWRILEALPPLGGMAPIPSLQNRPFPTVVPSEIIQRGKNRRIRMWIGAATVAVAVFLDAILRLDGASSIFLVMTAIAIAFLLPRKLNKQRATAATLVRESEGRYEALQRKYAAECGDQPFVTRVRSLESLRAEYTSLPLLRQRMLQELEKNKYGIQMQQYLDTFSIRTARILKVGDGRKQMLISYRVDTAADVTWKSLESVPGIGPKIARSIMEWRKGLEGKFRFDPQKAVGQLEIEKINREIRSRQSRLEQSINSGFREAMAVHAAISNKRKEYLNDLEQAVKHIAQARSNYRAS